MNHELNKTVLPPTSRKDKSDETIVGASITSFAGTPVAKPRSDASDRRPRRIGVEASRADSLLSHAIEYMADTRQLPSGRVSELSADEPEVQCIMVLMEARHQVFIDCPVIERRAGLGLFGLFKGKDRRKA